MAAILTSTDGHVATVTINHPDRLNAIRPVDIAELETTFTQLSDDTTIRVIVLTGSGRAFCAGGDVSILREGGAAAGVPDDLAFEQLRTGAQRTCEVIRTVRPVTIAAINGPCAGGGLALACATDIRLAKRSASLTTAFANMAQPGDMGLAWTLTRLLGGSRARELMLLSEVISADRAEHVGLVNQVFDDGEFAAGVRAAAERICAFAPLAVAAGKQNLEDSENLNFDSYLDIEIRRYLENSHTGDSREAAKAFLDRRPANYVGH